jgi:transcriptional regulator with XRE-family HTH domain
VLPAATALTVTSRDTVLVARVTEKGLGGELKQLREAAGLNRRQLAALAGVAYETVWNVEEGRRLPGIAVLLLILEALGCHLQIRRPDIPDVARARGILCTQARVQAGLSRRQLAERMGCPAHLVGRWERGEQAMQPWWETAWCAAVGLPALPTQAADLLT